MVEWPGNPVATMWVPNYAPQSGGEPATVRWAEGLSNLQTVIDGPGTLLPDGRVAVRRGGAR